jgi:hypothetical protein
MRVMPTPISAMITAAAVGPIPGISSRRATADANGANCFGPLLHGGDVGSECIDAGEHRGQQEPVVVAEQPDERLHKRAVLDRILPRAISASTWGSPSVVLADVGGAG